MIGDNIRKIRIDKGLGLNQLAKECKVSGGYLSDIENNVKKNPSMKLLENIARVLEVSVTDLVTTEEKLNAVINGLEDIQRLVQQGLDFKVDLKDILTRRFVNEIYEAKLSKKEREYLQEQLNFIISRRGK